MNYLYLFVVITSSRATPSIRVASTRVCNPRPSTSGVAALAAAAWRRGATIRGIKLNELNSPNHLIDLSDLGRT